MVDYDMSPVAFSKLSVKLKESFRKLSFTELAPHFNLPTVGAPLQNIPLFKSRLPLDIKKTCKLVQYATYEYGPLTEHRNEEARSRYFASLFEVVLAIFHKTIVNRPAEIVEGQQAGNGKIEHVFYAFSNAVIIFVEEKFELTRQSPCPSYRASDRKMRWLGI